MGAGSFWKAEMLRLSKREAESLFGKAHKTERKESKYHNRQTEWDGKIFDSQRERDRYILLSSWQKEGKIRDLRCQVPFELVPKQYVDGKLAEREVVYRADFTYIDENSQLVVEDAKGLKTHEYVIKRKLMLWIHKIKIREV